MKTMKHPLRVAALALLFGFLALAVICAGFDLANAPIERNITAMQQEMTAAQAAADAEHETRMTEQLAQLEARYEGFTSLDVPLDEWVQREIWLMCKEDGVPFEIVMGLAWKESSFDPNAVSDTNDHGLCQINQCNLGWLREKGVTDIYDPLQNARACLLILGPLWAKHEPHKALMAYQYGPTGAAKKWVKGQVTSYHSRQVLKQAEVYGWNPT